MSGDTSLLYLLTKSLRTIEESIDTRGLTIAQALVFCAMDKGINRASRIAERVGVTRQATHQIIHELINMDYIELVQDGKDKRAKLLKYKDKGYTESIRLKHNVSLMESHVSYLIGDDGLEITKELLEQLIDEAEIKKALDRLEPSA